MYLHRALGSASLLGVLQCAIPDAVERDRPDRVAGGDHRRPARRARQACGAEAGRSLVSQDAAGEAAFG